MATRKVKRFVYHDAQVTIYRDQSGYYWQAKDDDLGLSESGTYFLVTLADAIDDACWTLDDLLG